MFTPPLTSTRPRRLNEAPLPLPTTRPRTVAPDAGVAQPYPSPQTSGQAVTNMEALDQQQTAIRQAAGEQYRAGQLMGNMEALSQAINAGNVAATAPPQPPPPPPGPDNTVYAPGPSQRPRLSNQVDNALHEHMINYDQHKPQGAWGRTRQALKVAAMGALQGMATTPQDPISGAIFGAGAGGVIGAVRPDIGEEYVFSRTEQPRIEKRIQDQRAEQAYKDKRADESLERYSKAANIAYTQARTADIPVQAAIENRRYTQQQNQADAKLKLDQQQFDWQKTQQGEQLKINARNSETNAYKARLDERDLNRKEAESGFGSGARAAGTEGTRKLNTGDESALRDQAGAYVTKAFSPDEMNSILAEYVDKAYRARIKPEDEARARNYDPEAMDRVGKARTAAEIEARNTLKREGDRWQALFHDELRARAQRGMPPPQGGQQLTPAQVEAVAREKKITTKDAYRFLQAFGYTFGEASAPQIAVGHTQQ